MENRENVGKEAKKEVLIIIPAYNEEKTIWDMEVDCSLAINMRYVKVTDM